MYQIGCCRSAILEAEGDILKFAGDAILAFWQCSRFAAPDIVHHVLQQSLMMQSDFDNYRTQDGALLRMKIGLSVGTADIHYIGRKDFKTFDITGECVDDASIAQSVTRPGTVVLSKMAWEMCNKQSCFFRLVGHGCAMVCLHTMTQHIIMYKHTVCMSNISLGSLLALLYR